MNVLRDSFDFTAAITETRDSGYFFGSEALTEDMRATLKAEINELPLEVGDSIAYPINEGKPNEVRQQHERLYVAYGDKRTPVANLVIDGLVEQVRAMRGFPNYRTGI